ncbi:MAG: hypothetical protein V3U84_01210 [Thiotrichaceae bacterium]
MKLIKIIAMTTAIILILYGCAITKETYLSDGSKGYSISCDGAAVGINVCFEKAGELCGEKGYKIVNREGQLVPFGVGSATNQQAFVTYGSFSTKSIMIRCGNNR